MKRKAAPLDDPRAFLEWLVAQAGSQSKLASASGILASTVSDYVRGENEPRLPNVLKMMRGAGARLDGAPLQAAASLQEELAEELARLRRLNDALEEELTQTRRRRKRSG